MRISGTKTFWFLKFSFCVLYICSFQKQHLPGTKKTGTLINLDGWTTIEETLVTRHCDLPLAKTHPFWSGQRHMVVLPVPCIQVVVVWQVTVVPHGCLDCFCKAGWRSFGLGFRGLGCFIRVVVVVVVVVVCVSYTKGMVMDYWWTWYTYIYIYTHYLSCTHGIRYL